LADSDDVLSVTGRKEFEQTSLMVRVWTFVEGRVSANTSASMEIPFSSISMASRSGEVNSMSTVGGSTSKIDSHKRSEIGKVLIAVTVAVSFVDIAHAFETALYRRVLAEELYALES
jgi:hypothetical protein